MGVKKSRDIPKSLLDQLIRYVRRHHRDAGDYQVCILYAERIEASTGQSWLCILHLTECALYFNPKATNSQVYAVFSAAGLHVINDEEALDGHQQREA